MPQATGRTVRAALRVLGVPVDKVKKVSFQDLARIDAYFVTFTKPGDYKAQLQRVSKELDVRVLEMPVN